MRAKKQKEKVPKRRRLYFFRVGCSLKIAALRWRVCELLRRPTAPCPPRAEGASSSWTWAPCRIPRMPFFHCVPFTRKSLFQHARTFRFVLKPLGQAQQSDIENTIPGDTRRFGLLIARKTKQKRRREMKREHMEVCLSLQ